MNVLKLSNNIVVNIEVWDELPPNTETNVYIENTAGVGIGWQLQEDNTWLNTVFKEYSPKKKSADGTVTKYFDSAGDPDGETDELNARFNPDYDPTVE